MQPKPLTEFVRRVYSGPSGGFGDQRVMLPADDPRVDKMEFEREHTRIDFDLDLPRSEMGGRIQQYRVDEVWRMLEKVFEAGIHEGKRQIRETLREVIGLDLGR